MLEARARQTKIICLNDINLKQALASERRTLAQKKTTKQGVFIEPAPLQEVSEDITVLLNELVKVINELPKNVKLPWYNLQLDNLLLALSFEFEQHMATVRASTTLVSLLDKGFASILSYWKSFSQHKYQILFTNHPITSYVIVGLLQMAISLADDGNKKTENTN